QVASFARTDGFFQSLHALTIGTDSFSQFATAGTNNLDFVTANRVQATGNPTGFRAQLSGTAMTAGLAATATTVSSSAQPATPNQLLNYTAVVRVTSSAAASPTPTGTVTFVSGQTTLGSGTLNWQGDTSGYGVATLLSVMAPG